MDKPTGRRNFGGISAVQQAEGGGGLKFGCGCKLGGAAAPPLVKKRQVADTSEIPGGVRLIHVRRAYPYRTAIIRSLSKNG